MKWLAGRAVGLVKVCLGERGGRFELEGEEILHHVVRAHEHRLGVRAFQQCLVERHLDGFQEAAEGEGGLYFGNLAL